jgi:hypothetical protein
MTERARTAVGARLLASGASIGATLALVGGMATAAGDTGTATPPLATSHAVDPQQPAPPRLHPTTAPATTSSHAS